MTPAKRRDAVHHLEKMFAVSQRRACAITGQPRSTQRLTPPSANKEEALARRIEALVRENPRFGYRRITAMLRLEGWQINAKRVYRIWRREGYRVGPHKKKRRTSGFPVNACNNRRARHRNDIWAYDFVFDRLENGRPLKILAITDEYTRESIALEVAQSITGAKIVEILNNLVSERGVPTGIRSDNGSEFLGSAVSSWLAATGVEGLNVEKASPWQNGYAESFNSRFRDECLNMNQFFTINEARTLIREWQKKYNERRPHSALSGLPPAEFAKRCQHVVAGMVPASDELLLGPFSADPIPAPLSTSQVNSGTRKHNMLVSR